MTREDPELGTERYCRGCDEWWPDDAEFWYLGREQRCKACHAAAVRRYRERYPERPAASSKRWREANPDARRAGQARWRAANANAYREYMRRYMKDYRVRKAAA